MFQLSSALAAPVVFTLCFCCLRTEKSPKSSEHFPFVLRVPPAGSSLAFSRQVAPSTRTVVTAASILTAPVWRTVCWSQPPFGVYNVCQPSYYCQCVGAYCLLRTSLYWYSSDSRIDYTIHCLLICRHVIEKLGTSGVAHGS